MVFHPRGPTFLELAQQALSSTERGYDLLAAKFDYTPFRTPDELLAEVAPWIGEAGSLEHALDVCCGTGAGMRMLRPLCRGSVVGIDFSREMLAEAERRLADVPGDARLRFVRSNVLQMPFPPVFDVAVCFGALGHIPPRDQDSFVAEIAAALRPGGRFVIVTARRPPLYAPSYWLSRGFNAAMHVRNFLIRPPFVMFYLTFLVREATELLEAHGFQVEVVEQLFSPPFQRACVMIATKKF